MKYQQDLECVQQAVHSLYTYLEGAKDKLNKLIEEAINDIKVYGEKAEFLMELAIYIKDREK